MTDEQPDTQPEQQDTQAEEPKNITSPPGGKTHEATTPPGQGERDEEAVRKGEDQLDQAGGGH